MVTAYCSRMFVDIMFTGLLESNDTLYFTHKMNSFHRIVAMLYQMPGANIIFKSNPPVIEPSLTENLTLGCSIDDTGVSAPSGGLMGRDVTLAVLRYVLVLVR